MFAELGIVDYLGIDGSSVAPDRLRIPRDRFVAHNLTEVLHLGRSYDLAVSLEVAEHLPPDSAEQLVKTLVDLAPVVLFSAAVPGQGGTHHINEQWPAYWEALFAQHEFLAADAIRYQVWANEQVEPWYAQNTVLFVARPELAVRPKLQHAILSQGVLPLVHPRIYESVSSTAATRALLRLLPAAMRRAVACRLSTQWTKVRWGGLFAGLRSAVRSVTGR